MDYTDNFTDVRNKIRKIRVIGISVIILPKTRDKIKEKSSIEAKNAIFVPS